ncbi:uncharacterized protein EDB91DRAFT_609358 [Suillus paluster]|uniref:uncharacterized protein n=1 Tax=Suillus paluster TaxID=48578 RepID=UPI001B86F33E|nr:uncharacterized protein EDB91DRAFT_609358 [Suillus paluster]KAG1751466.1 hypothetical protein EDB91DRAFT_609358 [Suillus paluster]
MTMHRALGILDVIHTISSHTAHGSLPALASTSHAFKRPALEVLWRDLQSVEPLVRCLPSDLFGVDQGCWALKKPLDDKMWATLSGYTFHVHTITVTQTCPLKFIEALSLIMMSYPSGPASLFPNLRKLTWGADGTRGSSRVLAHGFCAHPSCVDRGDRCSFSRLSLGPFVSSNILSSPQEPIFEI